MNTVDKTGVGRKNKGDKLSSDDINKINSSLNSSIDAINYSLKDSCNLNLEVGDFNRIFTLEEAISLVPVDRRVPGLEIRFLSAENNFSLFIYMGQNVDSDSWENLSYWLDLRNTNYIDGGLWE